MPTIEDLFNDLKIVVAKARATGNNSVLHEKVFYKRHSEHIGEVKKNMKSRTVRLDCRTPEQKNEFVMAKDRYFELASDPHIAIDLMVWALNHIDDAAIRAKLEAGHAQLGDYIPPGPPKAEIPDWLKIEKDD